MVMQLGRYALKNPWILAPMAGVSEKPFRALALQLGAGAAPTELVSAKGLLYGQARTHKYLEHDAAENPFWVQLFGGDPESMAAGAEAAVARGAHIIDINMGCPVRKVTRNGAGSALLSDSRRAASLVAAIVKATGVPVTVKIRAGWDANSLTFEDMAKALADAGCVALSMHARTRAQGYSGQANWSWIKRLVEVSPIPVIGNGDAFTPADARRMRHETGCAAVMIGRGALGNPWIFQQLVDPSAPPPTPRARWALVRRHLDAHLAFVGDPLRGVKRFRPHLMWYTRGLLGASAFRAQITSVEDEHQLREQCADFFHRADAAKQNDSDAAAIDFEVGNALG
jgi:nifR3 family TIM-barrel protein